MPWFIKDVVSYIGKEYRKYHIINELNRLSDRELRDIGITRGEIPFIVSDAVNK